MSHPLCTFDIVTAELLEISTMNIGDVRRELAVTRTEKARLVAREIALVARMEALLTDETNPAFVVPEHELMAHAGMSSREARDAVNRSRVAQLAPTMGDVLADGRTTPAHLDLLGRGLQKVGADTDAFLAHSSELARAASTMNLRDFQKLVDHTVASVRTDDGLSTFERQRQNTYLRTWTDTEGMTNLRGRFDPVSGAAIRSVLEQRIDHIFHSGDNEVPVAVAPGIEPNDHRDLLACPTSSCCDSHEPAAGVPASKHEVPFHRCQIHHIDYWENGGRTDLDNQVPLCTRHHHAAHEGGWMLSLDPGTRTVSFQMPTSNPADYRCRRDSRSLGPPRADRRTRS